MICIRQACLDDHSAICRLAEEINRQHHAHSPHVFAAPPGVMRDAEFWRSSIDDRGGVFLVAQSGSGVIGFLIARILAPAGLPFLKARRICRIGTIVVARTMQGQGAGKKLMAAVEEWACDNAAGEIRLEVFDANGSAIGFYDALGFGMQSHIMTKALG